jgi:hypothetical protein
MRLPRFRFTVRRLMVLVAIAAVISALGITVERRGRFGWIAVGHRAHVPKHMPPTKPVGMDDTVWCPIEWHESMARKYEYAAHHPWLAVAPDPPEPR